MPRKKKSAPAPWGLTDLNLFDVAEVEMSADPHRLWFGFKLLSGQTIWLHVVHSADGFRVYVDQDRSTKSVPRVEAAV